VRVHIVAAAHRRLDAAAAGGALRRGDDGAVVLGHAAGHKVGTAAAAGQAADRHAAIMAVVVGHAGTTAGWGLGVSRAAQLLRQVVADAPLIIAEVARDDRQLEATQDGLLRLALEQEAK